MRDTFSFSKNSGNNIIFIVISGTIDEDTILDDVFADIQQNVVTDIAGITHINSCGIRTWVNAMEKVTESHDVKFINCSITMVRQFNMISNFGGNGIIESFKIPYYCETCDDEHDFTVATEEYLQAGHDFRSPEYTCPKCNNKLEFDDLEDKYFHFLKTYSKQR